MRRALLLCAALLLPVRVSAQAIGGEQPFRKWDAGGGIAIRFGGANDAVVPPGSWTAEVGRYWTAHIKTSVGVWTARQEAYNYDSLPGISRQTEINTRPTGFSANAAYQFYENVFVHPYLQAGIRLADVSEATKTYSTSRTYSLVSIETSPAKTQRRAIVAGGFKSYFDNGRAFMRSELELSMALGASPHAILHIGAGVDF